MKELDKIFAEAGITAEEFKQYFLDPAYPEKNPVVIDGIVYTQEVDSFGETKNVRQGTVKEILKQFPEFVIEFLKSHNIDEDVEIFIEWLAHHLTTTFDARGEKHKELKNKPKEALTKSPGQTLESPAIQESKSPVSSIIGALGSALVAIGSAIANLLPKKEDGDTGVVAEDRNIGDEQELGNETAKDEYNIREKAEANLLIVEKETKTLAKDLNIVDAVYDNKAFIIRMQRQLEEMARDKQLSERESECVHTLLGALYPTEAVKGVGVNKDNNIVVQYDNTQTQKMAAIIRVTGRLAMLRNQITSTATELKNDNMQKALKAAGKLSLGKGGKDVSKVEAQVDKRSVIDQQNLQKGKRSKEIT